MNISTRFQDWQLECEDESFPDRKLQFRCCYIFGYQAPEMIYIYIYIFIYWFEKKNVIGNLNINCGFDVLQLFRWIYNKDGARAPRDVDGRAIYTTNCANRHASSFSKSAIILIVTLNWHIVQPELQMNICVIMNIVWWWMCLVIIIQMLRVCWRLKDVQVN